MIVRSFFSEAWGVCVWGGGEVMDVRGGVEGG